MKEQTEGWRLVTRDSFLSMTGNRFNDPAPTARWSPHPHGQRTRNNVRRRIRCKTQSRDHGRIVGPTPL